MMVMIMMMMDDEVSISRRSIYEDKYIFASLVRGSAFDQHRQMCYQQ